MPKFYLDMYDGEQFSRDPHGLELENSEEARKEAMSVLPDLARAVLPDGDRRDFTVDVRTAAGEVIYTATLSLVGRWLKGLDGDAHGPAHRPAARNGGAVASPARRDWVS